MMATLAFIIVFLGFTALPIVVFEWFDPTPFNVLFWFLSLLFGLLMGFLAIIAFLWLYGIAIRRVDPHNTRNHRIGASILSLAVRAMNVKLTVTGRENIPPIGTAFILVSNHQENYDIIVLKSVFNKHNLVFVAKESIFKWPVIGNWAKKLGHIPIGRAADRSAAQSMVKAIRSYKEGLPVSIFPEGQRTFKNEMIPFKPGAMKLAVKPQADILPVTIHNFCMALKGWPFKRQHLRMHIHPIIPYDTVRHMNTIELARHVQGLIGEKLEMFETLEK